MTTKEENDSTNDDVAMANAKSTKVSALATIAFRQLPVT